MQRPWRVDVSLKFPYKGVAVAISSCSSISRQVARHPPDSNREPKIGNAVMEYGLFQSIIKGPLSNSPLAIILLCISDVPSPIRAALTLR